jgi:hypothetical protein
MTAEPTPAEIRKAQRARQKAGIAGPVGGRTKQLEHGTYAMAQKHYRNGEKPCTACLAAGAAYRKSIRKVD